VDGGVRKKAMIPGNARNRVGAVLGLGEEIALKRIVCHGMAS
jgi:hypothetical protein